MAEVQVVTVVGTPSEIEDVMKRLGVKVNANGVVTSGPKEEKPAAKAKKDEPEPEPEEKPSRRAKKEEPEPEEKPSRRSRKDDDEDESEEKPRRSRKDDDEDDEPPPRRGRRSAKDDDDEPEEKPNRRTKKDDDEDDEPPRRGKGKKEEEEDDEPEDRAPPPEGVDPEHKDLQKARRLRDVVVHLRDECGVKDVKEMIEICKQIKNDVPLLKRVNDIDERVTAAYDLLMEQEG